MGTYRSREELVGWLDRCPLKQLRDRLTTENGDLAARMDQIDASIQAQITAVIDYSKASPWPDPATALEHVFAATEGVA